MARRNSDLLAEIERDVLDVSKSVAAALRDCLALGDHAKSAELRDWASRELHGYPDEAPLPDYRKIRTALLMDGFTGGGIFRGKQVSVIDLPEEARGVVGDELPLTFGAGKIEALIRQAEARGGTIDSVGSRRRTGAHDDPRGRPVPGRARVLVRGHRRAPAA